jgi:hypothetical protein
LLLLLLLLLLLFLLLATFPFSVQLLPIPNRFIVSDGAKSTSSKHIFEEFPSSFCFGCFTDLGFSFLYISFLYLRRLSSFVR